MALKIHETAMHIHFNNVIYFVKAMDNEIN